MIGNISVGGTGKTPLVIWLAQRLAARGLQPGIVSRGYRGKSRGLATVTPDSDPREVGDEPVLIARRSGCPVCVGRDRAAAAQRLLRENPQCKVVISDDGIQHYRFARDLEIVVIDGERGLGNGMLLPAGPLREPASRLGTVDGVVVNGASDREFSVPRFAMSLAGEELSNLLNPDLRIAITGLRGLRIIAVAGIGHPRRFFAHLQRHGLDFTARALPDHHAFTAADLDLADADAIVMTEKDAVKCQAFAHEKCWALPIDAVLDDRFEDFISARI